MRRVKTDRSLLVYLLLTFVTCGIYGLIFIHELEQDVNEMCKDDGKTTQGLLMYILLGIVTCGIYGIIWWYGVADRVYQASQRRGVRDVESSSNYLLWYLLGIFLSSFGVGIVFTLIAQYKLFDGCNKVAAHYNMTGGQPPFGGMPPYGMPPYGQPPYGGNQNSDPPVW